MQSALPILSSNSNPFNPWLSTYLFLAPSSIPKHFTYEYINTEADIGMFSPLSLKRYRMSLNQAMVSLKNQPFRFSFQTITHYKQIWFNQMRRMTIGIILSKAYGILSCLIYFTINSYEKSQQQQALSCSSVRTI